MQTGFGAALKDWRQRRRLSQLDLGLSANVSARHISFLETGRSKPSRGMVLQLCRELEIPLSARNQLLTSAGLAPAYGERDMATRDMQPAQEALEWMLERHDPFPAIAMDRHWRILQFNSMAGFLLNGFGLEKGDSIIDQLLTSPQIQQSIKNLPEVAHHARVRLRTESAYLGGDAVLDLAAEQLGELITDDQQADAGMLPVFVPTIYEFAGQKLSLFSTYAQFGSAEDIALAEIKIEMMFPADDETRNMLNSLGQQMLN